MFAIEDFVKNIAGARLREITDAISSRLHDMDVEAFVFGVSDNDIDVAVLTDDLISPLFIISRLSPLLYDLSMAEGRLVTCTPIQRSKYGRADTAFVRNVIIARGVYEVE